MPYTHPPAARLPWPHLSTRANGHLCTLLHLCKHARSRFPLATQSPSATHSPAAHPPGKSARACGKCSVMWPRVCPAQEQRHMKRHICWGACLRSWDQTQCSIGASSSTREKETTDLACPAPASQWPQTGSCPHPAAPHRSQGSGPYTVMASSGRHAASGPDSETLMRVCSSSPQTKQNTHARNHWQLFRHPLVGCWPHDGDAEKLLQLLVAAHVVPANSTKRELCKGGRPLTTLMSRQHGTCPCEPPAPCKIASPSSLSPSHQHQHAPVVVGVEDVGQLPLPGLQRLEHRGDLGGVHHRSEVVLGLVDQPGVVVLPRTGGSRPSKKKQSAHNIGGASISEIPEAGASKGQQGSSPTSRAPARSAAPPAPHLPLP